MQQGCPLSGSYVGLVFLIHSIIYSAQRVVMIPGINLGVQVSCLPFTSCVTLNELARFSVPCCSPLQNGISNRACQEGSGSQEGFNELLHAEDLAQCLGR